MFECQWPLRVKNGRGAENCGIFKGKIGSVRCDWLRVVTVTGSAEGLDDGSGLAVSSLPCGFVQHNAAGYTGVQRFHLWGVWNGYRLIHLREHSPGQAWALAANENGGRTRELGLIKSRSLVRRGRNQTHALRLELRTDGIESSRSFGNDERNTKYRARRSTNHFGIEWAHRALAEHCARTAEG